MEKNPGQLTVNDTAKGLDDIGESSMRVGCLRVVDDPGTSRVSSGFSPGDSSLVHRH